MNKVKESNLKIKYIFCDIDGTLTELEKGALDLQTIKFLRELKKEGLEIVLVSGRGESETFFLSRDLGFFDSKRNNGYICENGGVICTFDEERRLQKGFTYDKIKLWEELREVLEYSDFQLLRKYSMYEKNRISDIIVSKECPILKNETLLHGLKRSDLVITDSGSPDVHIHHKRITKGEGIKQYFIRKYSQEPSFNLKKYLSSSIFCGNADNDIEAALAVSRSVAVHNASLGMIKASDYHAKSSSGAGVIEGIKHYLNIEKEEETAKVSEEELSDILSDS